jgi:hypothetical protein
MKKEELRELIREVVIEELNKINHKSEEKNNNNYDYEELLELFKNDKKKKECIIHFLELGRNPTKLEIAKYFAENNLYERDEDIICIHYGYYNDVNNVMEILRLKDSIRSKNRYKF